MKTATFRKTALVLGILTVLGTAGMAGANPAYHSPSNLSQEQATKAQEMITAHRAAVAPLMQQLQAKRAQLDAQLYSDKPDQAAVEKLGKDIGELQGQLYAARASFRAQLAKEGLPADCWQNGRDMAQGHGRGWGHGGGRGGGCGGGYGGGHW